MKKLIFAFVLIGFALSLSGGLVLAVEEPFEKQEIPSLTQSQLFDKFNTVANWFFTILIVFSVFMILVAAFQFVTGGPEGVTEARQKLIWAAVGIVLALLAKGIPALIVSVLE